MVWRFVREVSRRCPTTAGAPDCQRFRERLVRYRRTLLLTINAIGWFGDSTMPARFMALFELLDRDHPEGVYWPLLFAIGAPAIPFLLWKTRLDMYEDRRRAMLFVGALAFGLAPFAVAVAATPFVPALRDPSVQQRVGVVLYAALASIVPVTAYSVVVSRVMDLQFLVRITLQYALARYAVWVISLGPLVYLGLDIYANQQLTVAEYLQRFQPAGPLALSTTGLVALVFRQHLLRAIDRWFLLEPSDQSRTLAQLEQRYRTAGSLRGVAGALAEELSRALHARSVAVLLLNRDGTELVPVEGLDQAAPARFGVARDRSLHPGRCPTRFSYAGLDSAIAPASGSRMAGRRRRPPVVPPRRVNRDAVGHRGDRRGRDRSSVLGRPPRVGDRGRRPSRHADREPPGFAAGRPTARISRVASVREDSIGRTSRRSYCPECSLVWSPETRHVARAGQRRPPPRCRCSSRGSSVLSVWSAQGGMGVVYLAVDMVLDRQRGDQDAAVTPVRVGRTTVP